jgi:hypothetical protein
VVLVYTNREGWQYYVSILGGKAGEVVSLVLCGRSTCQDVLVYRSVVAHVVDYVLFFYLCGISNDDVFASLETSIQVVFLVFSSAFRLGGGGSVAMCSMLVSVGAPVVAMLIWNV